MKVQRLQQAARLITECIKESKSQDEAKTYAGIVTLLVELMNRGKYEK